MKRLISILLMVIFLTACSQTPTLELENPNDNQIISDSDKPLSYQEYFATEKTDLYTHKFTGFDETAYFINQDDNNYLYGYILPKEEDVDWYAPCDDYYPNRFLILDRNITSMIVDEYVHVIADEHEIIRFDLDGTNPITLYKDDEKISQIYGNHEVMCFIKNDKIFRIHFKSGIVEEVYDLYNLDEYYIIDETPIYRLLTSTKLEIIYKTPGYKYFHELTDDEKIEFAEIFYQSYLPDEYKSDFDREYYKYIWEQQYDMIASSSIYVYYDIATRIMTVKTPMDIINESDKNLQNEKDTNANEHSFSSENTSSNSNFNDSINALVATPPYSLSSYTTNTYFS